MSGSDDDDMSGLAAAVLSCPSVSSSPPPSHPSPAKAGEQGEKTSRTAAKVVAAFNTAEGVGARVLRTIGTPSLWNLSPFLIFDHASVGAGAGFPDHPHRGMATVTYVLEGAMQHEDFTGATGTLEAGDVQWMTAGRGIVHAEMPLVDSRHPRDAVALQLWVDLPAAKKMVKPSYKEKKASSLARATFPGGRVVVVSGESHGAVGPIRPIAGCWFLDFTLDPSAEVWQPLPLGWTAFVYVLEGGVVISDSDKQVAPQHIAVLSSASDQGGVRLGSGKDGSRFVVVAGEPLDQPMILQGPFVSTTRDAAAQALRDYQSGRNGFEKALGWRSNIGREVGTGLGSAPRRKPRKKGEEEWEERDPREKGRGGKGRSAVEEDATATTGGRPGGNRATKGKGRSGRSGKGGREGA